MGGFGLEVGDSLLYPPLPLAYTAALMENKSIPVDILDSEALDNGNDEILRYIEDGGFTLIGIISSLITLKSDLGFVDLLKKKQPSLKVFLTGPIIHLYKEFILKNSDADFTINTQNDDKPVELALAIESGAIRDLKGISWKDNGVVIDNPDEDRMIKMDDLPLPARHLLPNRKYHISGMKGPITTLQTARGCPYRCDICAYKFSQGYIYRTRSLDNVMDEIDDIVSNHGIHNIVFRDITFTVNRKRIMELCSRLIKADLDLVWWAETTLNLVDEELLIHMKKAGMDALSLGVEAGGEEAQEEHWKEKTLGLERTKAIFDRCRGLGIKTRGYFVLGFPGETDDCYKKTIKWARVLQPTTLQFLPYRELPADIDTYTVVDEELLKRIKKAYVSYYLTPANLMRQFMSPKLFYNRIKRFFSLRKR